MMKMIILTREQAKEPDRYIRAEGASVARRTLSNENQLLE